MSKKPKPHTKIEALKDFRTFVSFVWGQCLGLPGATPYQLDIANYLQNLPVGKDGISRGQIQAHRGGGKSYLTAAYTVWKGYHDPNEPILVVSSTARRAEEFVSLVRQIINHNEVFAHMVPRLKSEGSPTGKDQVDSASAIDWGSKTIASKDPSVVAYGISSTVTGSHPSVIIADDIETLNNGVTAGGRDKLMAKVAEFESLVNPKGEIIILGTPQSQQSIYVQMKEQYPIRRWPAEYPDPDDLVGSEFVSPWILDAAIEDPSIVGDPTHPERFDQAALEGKKESYGMTVYTLQMLINTSLADAERYPLKLKDLIVCDLDASVTHSKIVWGTSKSEQKQWPTPGMEGDRLYGPAWVDLENMIPYDRKIMCIDPAGSGGDETAYVIAASAAGMIFLLETGGYKDGSHPTTLAKLANKARSYGVRDVHVERNWGDGMFTQLLHPVMAEVNGPTSITEYKVTTRKEDRILDSLEPILFNHRLVLDTRVAKDTEFLFQYTHLARAKGSLKHDDRIDCVAAAVAELSDALIHNLDEAGEKAAMKAFESRVEEWESHFRTANGAGDAEFAKQFGKPRRSGKRSILDGHAPRLRGKRQGRGRTW